MLENVKEGGHWSILKMKTPQKILSKMSNIRKIWKREGDKLHLQFVLEPSHIRLGMHPRIKGVGGLVMVVVVTSWIFEE